MNKLQKNNFHGGRYFQESGVRTPRKYVYRSPGTGTGAQKGPGYQKSKWGSWASRRVFFPVCEGLEEGGIQGVSVVVVVV